jgi:restriction endonuclease Mrr
MIPNDLTQLSSEEFTNLIIAHFERQGYRLEALQSAPAGQLLLFRLDGDLYVVYCLPTPSRVSQFGDVTPVEVAWCIKAVEILSAARGYIITRSWFSFGAEKEARYAGLDIVLVDGETLRRWLP